MDFLVIFLKFMFLDYILCNISCVFLKFGFDLWWISLETLVERCRDQYVSNYGKCLRALPYCQELIFSPTLQHYVWIH